MDFSGLVDLLSTQTLWEFLGVVLAVLATSFGLLGSLGRVVERLLEARKLKIRRKNIKGLLLHPTVEEMARYSVKIPQHFEADELAQLKLEKEINRLRNDPARRAAEGRLLVLAVFFFIAFVVIGIRVATISLGS